MNPEERLRQMLGKARGDEGVTNSKWDNFATSARRSLRVQRFAIAGAALLLVAMATVGAVAAFDGSGPERNLAPVGPTTPDTSPTPDVPPSPTFGPPPTDHPALGPPPPPHQTEIWMIGEDHTLSWGWTVIGSNKGPLETALNHLLAGAIGVYAEVGETSAIPQGTELIGVEHDGETALINLNQEFLGGSDSDESMRLRKAQIVFTATALEGVNGVEILVEGVPSGDGVLQRSDFGEVSPPIVVESPKIGSEHSSPLVVSGTANVFEANVTIKLEIGTGKDAETIDTFTTATCGSGCRGDFSTEIEFTVDKPTAATLRVFEVSAEDGSRLNEVVLPLRLLPSD